MRNATVERKTRETDILLKLELDGSGKAEVNSGSGFFDHMLTLFAKQARVDLTVVCKGDVEVDFHHSIEDIGIALGSAFKTALGNKAGIVRYGDCILPMDEALVLCALDFSGRSFLSYDVTLRATKLSDDGSETAPSVGAFDAELIEEFLIALSRTAELTLHIKELSGKNTHHVLEAVFKGLGRAVRQAVAVDAAFATDVPSTKGVL